MFTGYLVKTQKPMILDVDNVKIVINDGDIVQSVDSKSYRITGSTAYFSRVSKDGHKFLIRSSNLVRTFDGIAE